MQISRNILIIGTGAVLVAVGYGIYKNAIDSESTSEIEKEIRVCEVRTDSISDSISTSGVLEPVSYVTVSSEISGIVSGVMFDMGDAVSKDDIIVELSHAESDTRVAQAAASVDMYQSQIDAQIAGPSDERKRQAQDAIAQAEAALAAVESQLMLVKNQATASVEQARLDMENALTAQSSGVDLNALQTEQAYSSAVSAARQGITAAKQGMVTVSDLQIVYPDWSGQRGVSVSQLKGDALEMLFDESSTGNWAGQYVASLNGGLHEIFSSAHIVSEYEYDALDALFGETILGIEKAKMSAEAMYAVVMSSANKTTSDINSITMTVSNIDTALTDLAAARNAAQQSVIDSESGNETKDVLKSKAERAYADAQAQAHATINQAEETVRLRESALAETKSAYDALVAKPRDVDLAALRASLRSAQASYARAVAERNKAFIRAPFDGIVGDTFVDAGSYISAYTSVASVLNDSSWKIDARISDSYANEVSVNDAVSATVSESGEIYEGYISRVSPEVNADSKTVPIEIILPELPDSIKAGIYATVAIHVSETKNTISVPHACVGYDFDGAFAVTESGNEMRLNILEYDSDGAIVRTDIPLEERLRKIE